MSKAFFDMIYLFACGAKGVKPEKIKDIDVFAVRRQAMLQGVWEIVFIALKKLFDEGNLEFDSEVMEKWHASINFAVMKSIKRKFSVYEIIKELESNGIICYILKGETLAQLYADPSLRIASDTDILIDEKLEKRAISILKSKGIDVVERFHTSNQTVCKSAQTGMIEMHISLNNKLMDDVWFDKRAKATEDYIKIKTQDGLEYNTIGITDGLILVSLHLIKHFINRAASIRMLMDTLLYMQHYKDQIDWKRFDELFRYLKYDKFIDTVIAIGIKFMFFTEGDLKSIEADGETIRKVLTDIQDGGETGFRLIEKMGFYDLYTSERFNTYKKGDYKKYKRKNFLLNLKNIIFLDKFKLANEYPYIKKSKFLLPIAWIHRIIKKIFIKETDNKKGSNEDKEIIKKRMELIRDLDMI